jgi:hypothetical protein
MNNNLIYIKLVSVYYMNKKFNFKIYNKPKYVIKKYNESQIKNFKICIN